MIHDKKEIATAINDSFEAFASCIENLDKQHFEYTPGGKWSAGQQLDHLVKSVHPLNMAFSLPNFVFPLLFGRINRAPFGYEALKEKYHNKLAAGGKASARYIPPVITFDQKANKLIRYRKEKNKLLYKFASIPGEKLDSMLLPHPLLGKITAREMMFFTIFHTQHHLKNIQSH